MTGHLTWRTVGEPRQGSLALCTSPPTVIHHTHYKQILIHFFLQPLIPMCFFSDCFVYSKVIDKREAVDQQRERGKEEG